VGGANSVGVSRAVPGALDAEEKLMRPAVPEHPVELAELGHWPLLNKFADQGSPGSEGRTAAEPVANRTAENTTVAFCQHRDSEDAQCSRDALTQFEQGILTL
jgi:hypothetical protein